ncbi:MAG: sel1 repeat family protein, partial [Clostridia bacterium]|nr:sel1 repeat family protein [Clostridia bacterium]
MKCKNCGFEWKSYGESIHCPDCATSAALTHNEQQSLWEDAHNAEKIKDLPLRASCYFRLAELGDKRAQYAYAECLAKGVGVKENKGEATLWYKAAARHMVPAAALRLAFCLKGKEEFWNETALFWLQVAAELDDAEAQLILANAYEEGDSLSPSHLHCLFWLTAAARGGLEEAVVSLAQMCAKGDGVEARPAVARGLIASLPKTPLRLLLLATRLGKGETEPLPDVVLSNREGERLAIAFKAEAMGEHLIAAKLYFLSAQTGNAKAQYHLGLCYEKGNGVPASATEARRRFGIAVKGGVAEAALALGRYAAAGTGGEKDDALALRMLTYAAEEGVAEAAYLLGQAYADGTLTESHLPTALKWYEQAAAAGHAEASVARTRLREATATIYEKGRAAEGQENYEAAYELYSAAADMGHTAAAYLLGLLCESGKTGRIARKEAFL